jgi:DNA-binding transcriptional LysR family regulator
MDAHLRDLRYFVAVAEELSFTRAANRLHLSQPALSKQIRGLEQALRAPLFDRNRREVRLTAAGKALLETARPLLAAWDAAAAAVADAAARDSRVLRLGTLTSIGRALYPGVVDGFAARQPGWRIELRSFGWGDATAGLRRGATDVAFLWLPVDADDLICQVLVTERRVLEMSSEHRLAGRSSVTFDEILEEPFVALPESAGPLRDFWLAADRRNGQEAPVVAEVTSADETFEIVASGAAVHLVAEGNAAIYSRPGLACVPVVDLDPARLAIAWRRDDGRAVVRAFVEACLDLAGSEGATGA